MNIRKPIQKPQSVEQSKPAATIIPEPTPSQTTLSMIAEQHRKQALELSFIPDQKPLEPMKLAWRKQLISYIEMTFLFPLVIPIRNREANLATITAKSLNGIRSCLEPYFISGDNEYTTREMIKDLLINFNNGNWSKAKGVLKMMVNMYHILDIELPENLKRYNGRDTVPDNGIVIDDEIEEEPKTPQR